MWRPGETVVWRNIWFNRVRNATPMRVVLDDELQTVLWHPEGIREHAPPHRALPHPGETIVEHTADAELILIYRPGEHHSVHIGRRNGEHFVWYGNFEEPLGRRRNGFDSRDLFLDLWVEPDHSWRLLDEGELDEAHRAGLVTDLEVTTVRAEAESVIARVERWESPFSEGWEQWRPDPRWLVPVLPPNWHVV